MFFLDRVRNKNGADVYRTKTGFTYPLQKTKQGNYKVQSGEMIRVCMTSDFFLEQADAWRDEAWETMKKRSDVKFYLLTKRPQRVKECLPKNWGEGWENIFFNITCENQQRADERLPILLQLPFRHKGIMCAPLIGPIHIGEYLSNGQIEQVVCGGENYDGTRECNFDWVKSLRDECASAGVNFHFIETGTNFIKDSKSYHLPSKLIQSEMAYKSGMNYKGKAMEFKLVNEDGSICDKQIYVPRFREHCHQCGSREICNGCSECGRCKDKMVV